MLPYIRSSGALGTTRRKRNTQNAPQKESWNFKNVVCFWRQGLCLIWIFGPCRVKENYATFSTLFHGIRVIRQQFSWETFCFSVSNKQAKWNNIRTHLAAINPPEEAEAIGCCVRNLGIVIMRAGR
ncbi:hypothetical protein LSM04_005773 [Trypanosoma melophagium]|uniref:uncharacterized protein n=1 Tax=Trypanosoma melophagium TaxID=715481 RepID=UPI00351A3DA9|nr:hypothetical protein LSM04_005773 [Trypanosoma melophagium]